MKQTQEKENKRNKRLQDSHVCDDVGCSLVQYKEQTSVAKKKKTNKQTRKKKKETD